MWWELTAILPPPPLFPQAKKKKLMCLCDLQVISEYRKARSLMDSMGTPNPNTIWHRLFAEAEKASLASFVFAQSL